VIARSFACTVGKLNADGYLMPLKKGQPPPDLRYFDQAKK
jgi:hypothetical protein